MALESFEKHGENVYLNGNNAIGVILKALDHMEHEHKAQARKTAFDDCTEYWKNELLKITIQDSCYADKWLLVTKLFSI